MGVAKCPITGTVSSFNRLVSNWVVAGQRFYGRSTTPVPTGRSCLAGMKSYSAARRAAYLDFGLSTVGDLYLDGCGMTSRDICMQYPGYFSKFCKVCNSDSQK
eukprot:SAG11_NODE_1501_length_4785_cov_26.436406_4_plen_103_part_00